MSKRNYRLDDARETRKARHRLSGRLMRNALPRIYPVRYAPCDAVCVIVCPPSLSSIGADLHAARPVDDVVQPDLESSPATGSAATSRRSSSATTLGVHL